MGRVGQIVTIPTGAYCNITLDSGEKIIVNHEPSGRGASAGARLTVERLKLMGFSSELVAEIKLDMIEGQAALAELTKAQDTPGSPLRVLVEHLHGCRSVAEVVARCRQLTQGR